MHPSNHWLNRTRNHDIWNITNQKGKTLYHQIPYIKEMKGNSGSQTPKNIETKEFFTYTEAWRNNWTQQRKHKIKKQEWILEWRKEGWWVERGREDDHRWWCWCCCHHRCRCWGWCRNSVPRKQRKHMPRWHRPSWPFGPVCRKTRIHSCSCCRCWG